MYRLVSSSSSLPTCDDMYIDSAEVTTIRMISASATPTILRRIDWLNRENDFTTPRIDCGEAGGSEPSCFKYEPCARDRNSHNYDARRFRSTSAPARWRASLRCAPFDQ